MLNSVRGKAKKSKVELRMNRYIIFIFMSSLTICMITALINVLWFRNFAKHASYMEYDKDNFVQ